MQSPLQHQIFSPSILNLGLAYKRIGRVGMCNYESADACATKMGELIAAGLPAVQQHARQKQLQVVHVTDPSV